MKRTLADTIADKAFLQPAIQDQWRFYVQTFGPILLPAYDGSSKARIHLINILNKIGRRELREARVTMDTLLRVCGCEGDAENALGHFLLGLMADASGDTAAMASEYEEALGCGAAFYLLHQKIAQQYQRTSRCDLAIGHYQKALDCLRDTKGADAIRGAILSNLAICHAMLGHLSAAHDALETADALTGALPGARAIYHAAAKNEEEALRYCQGADSALVKLVHTLLEDKGEDWDKDDAEEDDE